MTYQDRMELREERIAIMVHDGGLSEAEAQAECNKNPNLYGVK